MEELKDIKPVATLGEEPLYSAEQMQEYVKSQAKKVFWYSVKGTSEDRALLSRAIDYTFKGAQDEVHKLQQGN